MKTVWKTVAAHKTPWWFVSTWLEGLKNSAGGDESEESKYVEKEYLWAYSSTV